MGENKPRRGQAVIEYVGAMLVAVMAVITIPIGIFVTVIAAVVSAGGH